MEKWRAAGSATASAEDVARWWSRFSDAMNADLNTPAALGALFECITWSRHQTWSPASLAELRGVVERVRRTLGCFEEKPADRLPEEVEQLVRSREEARNKGDFLEADRVRGELRARGFSVRDTENGPEVRREGKD
jgi:cysteinyl-tRNA synthetase